MKTRIHSIFMLGLMFAIIQMVADTIKAIYESKSYIAIFVGINLILMIWLFKWSYHTHKKIKEDET